MTQSASSWLSGFSAVAATGIPIARSQRRLPPLAQRIDLLGWFGDSEAAITSSSAGT